MAVFFCYNCYREQEIRFAESEEQVPVRGEVIRVKASIPHCSVCGSPIAMPDSEDAILLAAYREYRRRHGLLEPEEIAEIRKTYGLSQRALARMLGWGAITIHRYERGGLPDPSQNQILKSLRDPAFVLRLLEDPACQLSEVEKEHARAAAQALARQRRRESAVTALEDLLADAKPSEFNGYRRPDPERLVRMAAYLTRKTPGEMFKVRLMKLLFYTDFLHFGREGVSISGFPYAAIPMGPVPDNYDQFLAWANLAGYATTTFVDTSRGPGEVLMPCVAADEDDFAASEREALDSVLRHLGRMSGSQLKDLSHQEPGWLNTPQGGRISYLWARGLRGIPVTPNQS